MFLVKIAYRYTLGIDSYTQQEFEDHSGITLPRSFKNNEEFRVVFEKHLPTAPQPKTVVRAVLKGKEIPGSGMLPIGEEAPDIIDPVDGEPFLLYEFLWNTTQSYAGFADEIAYFRQAGWDVYLADDLGLKKTTY